MSAIPASTAVNAAFMKFLPKVRTHAAIQFRHLRESDQEEAIAEAVAAAFVNTHAAFANGKAHRLTPSTVARYGVLHVKHGSHVGGPSDSCTDVMSRKACSLHRVSVIGLSRCNAPMYDCMTDPSWPVWSHRLLHDRRTSPADQAGFRIDLSTFLAGQSDRTRTLLSLLAEGHRQVEVADRMGITPAAICQRRKRALREWEILQSGEAARSRVGLRASLQQPRLLGSR